MTTKKMYSQVNPKSGNETSHDDMSDSMSKPGNNDNTSQLSSEDVLESDTNIQDENSNSQTNPNDVKISNENNISMEKYQNVANSQKQLRIYIANLENKLNNLRNEMKDNANSSANLIANVASETISGEKRRERDSSSDSNDSLREIKINAKSAGTSSRTNLFNDFLERRRNLENATSNAKDTRILDDQDEIEKSFIESQTQAKNPSGHIHNEHLRNDDDDILEKSLNKNSLNELLLLKSKRNAQPQDILAKKYDFEPIDSKSNVAFASKSQPPECKNIDGKEHAFSKSNISNGSQLLVNPKPIRLNSSSSSFDSVSAIVAEHNHKSGNNVLPTEKCSISPQPNMIIQSPRSNSSSTSSNIRVDSSSKIWKVKPSCSNTTVQSTESSKNMSSKSKWSDILMENAHNSNLENRESNTVTNENTTSFKAKYYMIFL